MSSAGGVAVVTGASRGIGAAVAGRLVDDGYRVYSLSRRAPLDPRIEHLVCDLSASGSILDAARRLGAAHQRIDLLVPNAAVRNLGPVADLSLQAWREAVDVNLSSVLLLVQALLPALRAARGRIVVMGSHAGSIPFEGGVAYCTTKAALRSLVEILLLEERTAGVLTTLLSPGAVANEADDDHAERKVGVDSVAETVSWVAAAPRDLAIGEIEIRPAVLRDKPVQGFDRLQAV